ncbi:hypothetical protein CH063_02114 [Colletotrichum higginsianum]|uniref:Natterin-like protein n=2 Tax=Colletotrichum higginsianum TaxID=80884 RepID=H1VGL1_COLHI|nr:Natterin-like protein [Colletotrichum higginsianum IMI 349063]OBR02717.1 Natterin-like protein [Colletotrichum higginsianum IMI 349063]TID06970.1 hypothetical protein CH35J_000426 [Colletotrichum higginsianum]GJD00676.1 Natterin-like protein [Colletotrichum higginsianum]CCF39364.1 hypothetical protein CH063_02114 [Colletotrichum higginsianum]
MSYNSFSLKHILLGATLLHGLTLASPIGDLAPRAVKVVDAPVAEITPNVIHHGPLDDEGLRRLKDSLISPARRRSMPEPHRVKRQLTPTSTIQGSLTVTTKDAFVSIDVGELDLIDSDSANCHSQVINGPVNGIQMFMGAANIRAMNVTSATGNTTQILSNLTDTSKDAGVFVFDANDKIKEFSVRESRGTLHGFSFTTESGKSYTADATALKDPPPMVKVPIGSGILARIRVEYCDVGLFGHIGFDFLDELQSISISNIAYSGFTNDFMPAGPGQTMTVGSQIVDNRNSSAEQTITLWTTDTVTKSRTVSVSNMWNIGTTHTIEAEVSVPFIGKSKTSHAFTWGFTRTTGTEETESETLTKTATINLKCPPFKYCVGSSFFTIFKLDVDIEATFRAKTKTGHDFSWMQKGKYKGADSLALQLQVDEADNVIAKRATKIKQS